MKPKREGESSNRSLMLDYFHLLYLLVMLQARKQRKPHAMIRYISLAMFLFLLVHALIVIAL